MIKYNGDGIHEGDNASPQGIVRANLGARFLAFCVDYIILEIFIGLATLPVKHGYFGLELSRLVWLESFDSEKIFGFLVLFAFYFLVNVVFWGFYFTFFHWAAGQTIGKKLLRIKVVKRDDSTLGVLDALTRWIGLMFGLFMFGLGLLWAIFNKEKQGWHDKMAGTIVIAQP